MSGLAFVGATDRAASRDYVIVIAERDSNAVRTPLRDEATVVLMRRNHWHSRRVPVVITATVAPVLRIVSRRELSISGGGRMPVAV